MIEDKDPIDFMMGLLHELDELKRGARLKDVAITTITMSVQLSQKIDFDTLVLKEPFVIRGSCRKRKSAKVGSSGRFNNAIIIHHETVAIKAFANGVLHITGVKDVVDGLLIAYAFCDGQRSKGDEGVESGENTVCVYREPIDYNIQMINIMANIGFEVNLSALHNVIYRDMKLYTKYNTDNHAAVITKVAAGTFENPSNMLSFFVFDSGNVIMSGITLPEHVKIVGGIIGEIVEKYRDVIEA